MRASWKSSFVVCAVPSGVWGLYKKIPKANAISLGKIESGHSDRDFPFWITCVTRIAWVQLWQPVTPLWLGGRMKIFSPQELQRENGENGSQTLVAVDGKVYDISSSKKWLRGKHMNRHKAGMDLSADIRSAPHGLDVLERFELKGRYEEPSAERQEGIRTTIEGWLTAYPYLRRHPHPAVVHFPLGLLLVVPLLEIVGLGTKSPCTEWAACCCLILGLFFMPAVIATGYFTWWINYEAKEFPTIRKKRHFAWIAFGLAVFALIVRAFFIGDPLQASDSLVISYAVLCFGLAGVIGGVGFLGGTLTFPYEHE